MTHEHFLHPPLEHAVIKGETRRPAKLAITGCGRLLSNKSPKSPLITFLDPRFGPTALRILQDWKKVQGISSHEFGLVCVVLWGKLSHLLRIPLRRIQLETLFSGRDLGRDSTLGLRMVQHLASGRLNAVTDLWKIATQILSFNNQVIAPKE